MKVGEASGALSAPSNPSRILGFRVALSMALRGVVRAPGTSLVAVLVLILGMAAPVTFFSLLVGAIRPLPVPEGEQVVRVEITQPKSGGGGVGVTMEDLRVLQGSGTLESLGAYRVLGGTLTNPGHAATRVSAAAITEEVLPILRVTPVLGRIPDGAEGGAGLLLGYDLWQDLYEGDPAAVGRSVALNGDARVIAGVLPQGFGFPFKQNAWVLLEERAGDEETVELVGRLADGASPEAASVELAGRWARRDPLREPLQRGALLEVESFTGGRGEGGEAMAFLGLVMVALALLLIACSNVANLLLVRAIERVRVLGVQSALGAGRLHLASQLFLEALILALVGGVGGLLLAAVGVDAIQKTLAEEHFGYFWMRMAVDGRVMLFAGVLVGGAALLAGTLPVLRVLGSDLQGILKEGGRGASGMGRAGSWARGFVTAQLALSCSALVAAGLTGESLARSASFGRGVPADEILVASMDPGVAEEEGAEEVNLLWTERLERLEEGLAGVSGAREVALALGAPGYFEPWGRVEVEGVPVAREEDRSRVYWNAVTPEFFDLLGIGIRQGRGVLRSDRSGSLPVAVVGEAFAREHLPGDDPLGRRVRVAEADAATYFTIVGVVEDVDMGGGPGVPNERVYLSLSQLRPQGVVALLRGRGDPAALTTGLRETVAGVDPEIPLWSVRTLADAHAYIIRVPRAMSLMALAGGLGGLGVAAVGLFGLLAFRVRQRRRELGVRMALGADGPRLAREVMGLALRQLLPALGVGLFLAWLVAPALGAFLLGLNPRSPVTYLGVAGVFIAVGVAAALVPARRAARVEPAEVLRGD